MSTNKQKKTNIYLIGREVDGFGKKLPNNREVLSVFFHKHNSLHFTIRESATSVVNEIINVWDKTGIPVGRIDNLVNKLEKLYKEWQNLKKSQYKKSTKVLTIKRREFRTKLKKLFDIARKNGLEDSNDSQKEFSIAQRSTPREVSSSDSQELALIPSSSSSKKPDVLPLTSSRLMSDKPVVVPSSSRVTNPEYCNEENAIDDVSVLCSQTLSHLSFSDEPSSTQTSLPRTDSNFSDEIVATPPRKPKIDIITPQLALTLDRTAVSSRSASYILKATCESLNVDVNMVNVSRSAIHAQRTKCRTQLATQLRANVQMANYLVVHWDGKLLPDINGTGKVERLPIVVSGDTEEHLLGVPKLPDGTGVSQAKAVINTLMNWNISESVVGMCFDTTAVNTGLQKGTCTLLERELDRKLLNLACRHHTNELILRSVVESCWPETSGPNVPIFARFHQSWDKIDKQKYKTGITDELIARQLEPKKEAIEEFILNQFKVSQPRNDYRELLELAYIFLGGIPPRGIRFKTPGAMHHARWLSKAIYCLKMFLFRDQFRMSARLINDLRDICVFIVLFYIKSWFNAPCANMAALNDLALLQDLIKWKSINPKVSTSAQRKLALHLWYLSEHLVGLAFFDNNVPYEVKMKMALALKNREGTAVVPKRVHVNSNDFKSFSQKDLDATLWKCNESYKKCVMIIKHLKVVNDIAERGVALIEKYNDVLTKDEDQKQYLLRMVRYHQKILPDCTKKTFLQQKDRFAN